jgi:hypothetical protein
VPQKGIDAMPPAQPQSRTGAPWKLVAACLAIIASLVTIVAAGRVAAPVTPAAAADDLRPRVEKLEQQVGEIRPTIAAIDERTKGMAKQLDQIQGELRHNRQQP